MDSLITAAARALAAGDPLGALKRVALRDDAPALALRGIAMAQLGDLVRAKALLRSAARAFSPREAVARARCLVAEAEIALASRDLSWPVKSLEAARATLEAHGDRLNAAHARYLEVRRLLLIGRLEEAEHTLAQLDPTNLPPALKAVHELVAAGIALRRLQTKAARDALARARLAASQADIPALTAEVESASLVLNTPAARLIANGAERTLLLEDVEALQASKALVVGCVPLRGACRGQGGVARKPSGIVRTRTRAGRSVARRRSAGCSAGARIRSETRGRIAPRAVACRNRAAAQNASDTRHGKCDQERVSTGAVPCTPGRRTRAARRR